MRPLMTPCLAGCLGLLAGALFADDKPAAKDLEFFEKKIRPVLVAQCYECHSAEAATRGKLNGSLAVDSRAGLLKGGDTGSAIVPGKSLLLKALKHDANVSALPPKEKLSAAVIADFETWIGAGATDLREGPAAVVKRGLAYLVKLQELTLTQNTARSDRYRVMRRLADAELKLAKPDADKATLKADIARMNAEIKDWDVKVKGHEESLQTAMDSAPPQPGWAMGVRDRETPEDCRIHIRGETMNLGLGLDHEQLTYRHCGRDFRLTDVHGRVVSEVLA